MSKIFYDHLIILDKVDVLIKKSANTSEEREELWNLVDQIIHPRVLTVILDNLPTERHDEFLQKFHTSPYDENIITYLNKNAGEDIEKLISNEIKNIEEEIIAELNISDK